MVVEVSHRPLVYRTRDLVRTYQMGEVEVHALRGVDLELYEQEFVVLLGPSGSSAWDLTPRSRPSMKTGS